LNDAARPVPRENTMYQQFFGLHSAPFDLTPNPEHLLLTPMHREALNMLQYGISARKGIILLVGEAGTGKTTLLRKSLSLNRQTSSTKGVDMAYVVNPTLSRGEFFQQLTDAFGFDADAATSTATFLKRLEQRLIERRKAGLNTALIVDEAQRLSDELIEELRLLVNIELDDAKLLPLVLAGHPELAERLNADHLRQFKQRIVLRYSLSAFDLEDTAAYIIGRMRLAGGDATRLFTREALVAVKEASGGIPRTINVLCDNALLTAFGLQRRRVDKEVVLEVCRDLHLPSAGSHAGAARSGTGPQPVNGTTSGHEDKIAGRLPTGTRTWWSRRAQ
jgi:general secretion pathway protein A